MQNAQTNFGALWNGSPQFATKNSLLSTSYGLDTKITTTSNVLQGEINAIVAGGTTALWANYKAIKAVDLSGNNLSNANTITATSFVGNLTGNTTGTHTGTVNGNTNGTHTGQQNGNVAGNVVGNLSNASLTLSSSNSMNLTNDRGSDVGGNSVVDINANYGAATRVNINANAASAVALLPTSQVNITAAGNTVPVSFNPIGGKITLTANAGTGAGTGILGFGEIDLTAYSAGAYAGVIKLSAGANMIYSGPATPYLGLYGQNTMYGATANAFIAGTPPTLPTLVGTNYFYGALGVLGPTNQVVGNRMQGGLGVDFLQPFPNGDLIIQSNANGTDTVVISGVKSLTMSNGGNITGVGNINLTTINNAAYPPVSALNPVFNSVSTNQLSTGASFISSINGLPMSAYTNVGDATFNSVSTNQLSTGASFISSINGLPMSAYTNVGDATFNSISVSKISTARVWMSSINDSIYFTNQPLGNSITGINDLFAQTAVFNTSLASYGSFTAGSCLVGTTRITGLFRITNGSGFNVATIDTAGAITGTSLAVSGAITGTTIGGTAITGTSLNTGSGAITGGVGSFTNTTASGSATVNNGLTVVAGGAIINGATNIDTLNGVNLTYTNANLTTATIPTANITNTNTGKVNAGAGTLALTYGSITFNGSPYAPTAGTSSDPTFNSISTSKISTAQVFLSSINGYAYVPGGSISQDPTFNSISTNTISTAQVFLSSLNGVAYVPNQSTFTNFTVSSLKASTISITGGLFFSTIGSNPDITHIFTSTTSANYDAVSSITNNILNYQMNLTSLPESFDMGGFLDITNGNRSLWFHKTIIYSGGYTPGQNPTLNLVGAVNSGDYFDIRNTSATLGLSVWNPYESGGFVMNILPGQFYRFTYTTSWAATANPTQTVQTTSNLLSLVQGWNNTIISTNNILTINAGLTNIIGFAQLGNTNITDLTAVQGTFVSSQTQLANISSLNASTMNLGIGYATTLNISSANISTATVPLIFNTNFAGRTLTASSITASSITGCLFNSLVSTVATKSGIDGATQQLLNASVAIYSPIPTLNLTQLFTFNDANYSYWNNNGFQAGNQPNWFCRIETLVVNTSAQVDFYIGDYAVSLQIGYSPTQTTYIGNIASGFPQKVRFYFSGGTWYFTNTFSGTTLDNNNSLTINQNISQTLIQTTDSLILSTSLLQIYGDTYLNNLIGQYFNVSTISSLNTYTGQIVAATTTTGSLSTNAISTNSITTNTLTTNSLITTAPLTVPSLSTNSISTSLITVGNLIASTRLVSPSISTLKSLNGFNTRLINNPGNVLVYTQTVSLGNGAGSVDINTDPFVPGVYTCSAVCRGNVGRSLEGTLYYTSRTSLFCENANGFDNYNVCWWHAYNPGYVRFTSRTDGPGDTFDIYIYMISGQYTAIGDDPPFPQASTITATVPATNTGTYTPIIIGVSSFTGSTIAIKASENLALIAGLNVPTFLGVGTIGINASTNVDIMANVDCTIGAAHDFNATATSHINLTSPAIKLDGAVEVRGNLNMSNHNINNVNRIDSTANPFVLQAYNDMNHYCGGNLYITTNSGHYIGFYQGSSAIQIDSSDNINLVAPTINVNGGLLQMNCNAIRICSDQYHALAFGNSGTYNVGVNGPYLVGYNNGALGTSGTSFNNKSLEWSYTDVYVYKRLDMCNNNISNAGTITSSNVYAGAAVIGTPSAFGSNFAYFGHKSLAANGTEYALIQSDGGETLLNCKSGSIMRFRQNNTDIFVADATHIEMCNHSITGLSNLYSAGDFNIFAPSGLGIGLNNNTYFNNFALGDVGGITMTSGGIINLNSGYLNNVSSITSKTVIATKGNPFITPVSPLALINGNVNGGGTKSQIEFQFQDGGYNHFISSRHYGSATDRPDNAIDFWLYNTTGGQYGSSVPGTGNVNTMSITAAGVDINYGKLDMHTNNISNIGSLYFSNSAYIDCVYSNQFNFHATNSYYFGNLRFYGSGLTLDIASNTITNVQQITFLGGDITTGSNYLDIHGKGSGNYASLINGGSYYTIDTAGNNVIYSSNVCGVRATNNVYIQSDSSYIELVPNGGAGTIYHTAGFTEFRGNAGFTQSNSYISGLAHIYGNLSATGGGLTIDYMYGLFFNSAGNNANLFCSGGNYNMTNYNGGIYIGNYNAPGTGNISLYSASNDVILATGAGHNIAINSGSNIYLNAAGSDGLVAVYTSTMNTTSLLDTNITGNRAVRIAAGTGDITLLTSAGNFNASGAGAGHYASFNNGSSYLQFDNNLNITLNSSSNITITNGGSGRTTNFTGGDVYFSGGVVRIPGSATQIDIWNYCSINQSGGDMSLNTNSNLILSASNTNIIGNVSRRLISTDVAQPVIQTGVISTSGTSGTITVSLPQRYTTVSSYIPFATPQNYFDFYAKNLTRGSFEIGWSNTSGGTEYISWMTTGT
jgi:hypothetical protein